MLVDPVTVEVATVVVTVCVTPNLEFVVVVVTAGVAVCVTVIWLFDPVHPVVLPNTPL